MKNTLFLFLLLFSFSQLAAQDCKNDFFFYTKGMKYNLDHYDKKGQLSSSTKSEVLELRKAGDSLVAKVQFQALDAKGKTLTQGVSQFACLNGVLIFDLRSMAANEQAAAGFKDASMELRGTALQFPAKLSVGQTLNDGDVSMIFKSGSIQLMKMSTLIKNRKVEALESVTVKAGTYQAYKITYEMEFKSIISRQMKVVQWMAPSVGMVKSENYDKAGKLESWSELSSIGK
jgi:hypothetical protein